MVKTIYRSRYFYKMEPKNLCENQVKGLRGINELGKYQEEWLFKYNKIDLSEWAVERRLNERKQLIPDWYYVGNWTPTKVEPYPSKLDGGYGVREKNIQSDPYFYWPKSP